MSDKKKEKKSGFLKKKHKRFLVRMLMLIVIGGSSLALWKPELIQNEAQRQKVIDVKTSLGNVLGSGQESVAEYASPLEKIKEIQTKIPKGLVLGEQDIYIEDTVKAVSSELEKLPGDYYQNFKASFCADVVSTMSAQILNSTESPPEN